MLGNSKPEFSWKKVFFLWGKRGIGGRRDVDALGIGDVLKF